MKHCIILLQKLFYSMIFIISFLTLSSREAASAYPIAIAIGTPRTGSTAFVRLIDETGKVSSFNEPFLHPYFSKYYPALSEEFYGNSNGSYSEVIRKIEQEAEKSPVFIKDMIAPAGEYLLSHPDFISKENVHIIFLTRDPYSSLKSILKVPGSEVFLNEHAFDYKKMIELYKIVKSRNPNPTKVISIEEFTQNIEQEAPKLFRLLGIPVERPVYTFPARTMDEVRKRIHDPKLPLIFERWHGRAGESGGIFPIGVSNPLDDGGSMVKPFEWIENRAARITAAKLLRANAKGLSELKTLEHPCSVYFSEELVGRTHEMQAKQSNQ